MKKTKVQLAQEQLTERYIGDLLEQAREHATDAAKYVSSGMHVMGGFFTGCAQGVYRAAWKMALSLDLAVYNQWPEPTEWVDMMVLAASHGVSTRGELPKDNAKQGRL